MAQQYTQISDQLREFINQQKIFFVATATAESQVNLSPKGMDSFKVLDENRVIWLNVTGSGNETAAHVQENPRMTIMFTAFDGSPMILRLYGKAQVVHKNDENWQVLSQHFEPLLPGARQIFDLQVDMVQTSCGMAVPYYEYTGEREQLNKWATQQGAKNIEKYWLKENQVSIDGIESHIKEKNL